MSTWCSKIEIIHVLLCENTYELEIEKSRRLVPGVPNTYSISMTM